MQNWIDLRSDTVTKPSPAMLQAMMAAEVGDDVYGEDPTVIQLEEYLADQVGTESAVFVSSGTQANLLAILSHCGRGDEYIAGQEAHLYKWEGGGAAVLGGVQPQPLDFEADGSLDLVKVQAAVKAEDNHFAKTRLFCLENTQSGKVLPLAYLKEASLWAKKQGLRIHLDGARAFNAAVKLGVSIREVTQPFHSISICLSKGLGAPVGSVLCGPREMIKIARRWRKVCGGGMRQCGILAAAGLYALEHNVDRLAEDHENAAHLAQHLRELPGVSVDESLVQTNMVFLSLQGHDPKQVADFLKTRGILVFPSSTMRLVTHLDIHKGDLLTVVKAFREALLSQRSPSVRKTETVSEGSLSGAW